MGYRTSPVRMARLALLAYLFSLLLVLCARSPLIAQDLVVATTPDATPSVATTQPYSTTWLPLVSTLAEAEPPPIVGMTRADAARLYRELLLPATTTEPEYSGDVEGCRAGAISQQRRDALLDQVNYFRAMAGVEPVTEDDAFSKSAQTVALMMAANDQLTHTPEPFLRCYAPSAAESAALSNLSRRAVLNAQEWPAFPWSPTSIMDQMEDAGTDNADVAHRYWLLHPLTWRMGIGEVYARHDVMRLDDETGTMQPTRLAGAYAATFVVDPQVNYARQWEMVAWPPPGWVPRQVVYPRWSLHFPQGVELKDATVSMWLDGAPLPVRIIHRGEEKQTLVWEPDLELVTLEPTADHALFVEVNGVSGHAVKYEVRIFDAD